MSVKQIIIICDIKKGNSMDHFKNPIWIKKIMHYLVDNRYHIKQVIKKWLLRILRFGLFVGISYVILYPVIIKTSLAFMTKEDLYDITVLWIPQNPSFENFRIAIKNMDFFTALLNTFLLSASTTLLQLFSCSLAAYGFARFKFRFREFFFLIVVFTLVVPPQTYMVSTYILFRNFDILGIYGLLTGRSGISLLNTFWPHLLNSVTGMGIRSGLYIYILRQFFRGMPNEIEESAWVDGAGVLKTFFRIMLPNAIPAMVTVALFSFVWQWNDIQMATILSPDIKLLSTAILYLPNTVSVFLGGWTMIDFVYASLLINAASLLFISPLIVFYIILQRYFIEGVERAGIIG